jgi:peptidyl-prolyl cis-trans isomerase C
MTNSCPAQPLSRGHIVPITLLAFVCALTMVSPIQAQTKATKMAQTPQASTGQSSVMNQLAQTYVTVNGTAIPNAHAEVLLREQLARGVADSAELRTAVRDTLISQTLMAQQASKLGLDANPLVQAQSALAQKNVLSQAWQQSVLGDIRVEEEDIRAEYARQVTSLSDKDYLIRHLLLKEEPTAKLLIDKINAGSKLGDLALDYSQDPTTRERGGLADWTNAVHLLPALADAVKLLPKGQFTSQPIKTDSGWHVVQLEDVRANKPLALEEVKPQIAQILARRKLDEQMKALRDRAQIQ